jgi:hypothetical protein
VLFSKRSLEGYLMVDHRAGDGMGNMRGLVEQSVYTCCGCQRGIIRNPARERARNYCRAHDRYMCDDCALSFKISGSHKSFKQIMDEQEKRALTASQETTNG